MSALARRIDRATRLAGSDPAAAIAALEDLRRDNPGNPRTRAALRGIARSHLAEILPGIGEQAKKGDWRQALRLLRPLAAADPDNPGLATLAAEGLNATGEPAAALKLCERARRAAPDNPGLCAVHGDALRGLGQAEAALVPLRHGLSVAPGDASCAIKLGMALLELGDRDGAVAAWRATLAVNPRAADCWMNLAPLVDFTTEPELFAALERAATAPGLSAEERECLLFAHGEALLQRGDGDGGFAVLARANAMRRRALGYDLARDEKRFAVIRRVFGSAAPLTDPVPAGAPRPILITGLPRSGTTLTEQILAAHPMVHGAGELDDLNHAVRPHLLLGLPASTGTLRAIAAGYRAALTARAGGAPVITDKMPLNFRHVGAVLAALPEARVVHLRRDPMAVGFSCYRLRFSGRGNGFAYDLGDLGRYTRMERALVADWQARWPADRLMVLDYAALTADPEPQIRALLDFCALPFDPACLAPHLARRSVATASAAQVRQPIYRGSTEAWRRFAPQLAPLAAALTGPDGPAPRPAASG